MGKDAELAPGLGGGASSGIQIKIEKKGTDENSKDEADLWFVEDSSNLFREGGIGERFRQQFDAGI
jgi:hypothetical protein